MTILEVLIALMIASGVLASSFEIYRQNLNRAAESVLGTQTAVVAESLLTRVGADIPYTAGRFETRDEETNAALEIQPVEFGRSALRAFHVVADVTVTRGGATAHVRLSTIKLEGLDR